MNFFPGVGLLVPIALLIGYGLATRVPDEMKQLEMTLRILQGVGGVAFFFVIPLSLWWVSLLIAGALALGWYVMILALGLLAASHSADVTVIATPLALLAGARWNLDKRGALPLVISLVAACCAGFVLHGLGWLGALG